MCSIYTSSLDARPPGLIERINAVSTLGSLGVDFGESTGPDRHVSALSDQVLRERGVRKPDPQLVTINPSRSLTWVPNR